MKNYRSILFLFILVIIGSACKHAPDVAPSGGGNTGTGGGTGTGAGQPDTSLCFERDILPIFISGCSKPGCHDAASRQDGYILTDWQHIVAKGIRPYSAHGSDIYEAITEDKEDKRMPQAPNPRLSADQVALIGRWINQGAKNTTGCAPKSCDDNVFTYSGAIVPIVNSNCKGCHNSASPAGGIVLDTYAGIKTVANNNRLLGATQHTAGYSPMPKNGNKLSSCQLSQIEKWIAAGAPNN